MLHGRKKGRRSNDEALTIKFLKKYIHYAKHRIQPDLTDEVYSIVNWLKILFFSFWSVNGGNGYKFSCSGI